MTQRGRAQIGANLVVGILLAATADIAIGQTANTGQGRIALLERAKGVFGLRDAGLASLAIDNRPEKAQRVRVPLANAEYTLDIQPHSVRAANYEVRYYFADGTYVSAEPDPVRTFRGTVDGIEGAIVAGSMLEDGMLAVIDFPDHTRLWIEPLSARVEGAAVSDHVLYWGKDVVSGGGSCATEANAAAAAVGGEQSPEGGGGCEGSICVTELACDSDTEYFDDWGSQVESRINSVTNVMNVQYERDVGITHQITTLIVRPETDPYTSNMSNTLLSQFRTHWLTEHDDIIRDVAELFTGRNISGSVIGQAWTIGGICTTSGFCYVQSDCCGSFSCVTDLSAHELGHLWRGFHCNCFGFTMNPSITCANRFHPEENIPGIIAHRNSRTCLSDVTPTGVFPVIDSFETPILDNAQWLNAGVEVSEMGAGEPSPPFSIDVHGPGRMETGFLDASDVPEILVDYWWQRAGSFGPGGSPEAGEDLVVEYRNADGDWIEFARHLGDPGDGGDQEPFERECITLGPDASSGLFQVRFRVIDAEVGDHFFVDDVRIVDATLNNCDSDQTPPEIVHATGLQGETTPFSGFIDPRSESTDGTNLDRGLTQLDIVFSEPVEQIGGGTLSLDSFVVTETGGGTPPAVLALLTTDMPRIRMTLSKPITPGEYTTIRAVVQDTAGNPIANSGSLGTEDEPDRIDIGFLPGDIDQNGVVGPVDVLRYRQILNELVAPEQGVLTDYLDMGRDGFVDPFDVLIFRQLINGTVPATQPWAGATLNNSRP